MPTSPEYDAILARKMKEHEIKGNVSSQKMTPEQTQAEIAAVTEGAFAVSGEPTIAVLDKIENGVGHFHAQSQGYRTKSGRLYRSKPGRKRKDAKS